MNKITLIISLFTFSIYAQELTKDDLNRMRQETIHSEDFTAKQNALTNNSINSVAYSRATQENYDMDFSNVIRRSTVTNQKQSGRCWLFAGLNVARYDAAKEMNINDFEFSEDYLFFFHKLELANYILENTITGTTNLDDPDVAWILRNGLGDGGYWGMFTNLVEKYGVVPKSVMPETRHSSNTGEMNYLLEKIVKRHMIQLWELKRARINKSTLRMYKKTAMSEIYRYLALTLGTPPIAFQWRYKDKNGKLTPFIVYTPQEFSKKYLNTSLYSKVHLMNDPSLDYNKLYKLVGLKNVIENKEEVFLNVQMDIMVSAVKSSIIANKPVWFGSDVMQYANISNGVLDVNNYDYERLLGFPVEMNKQNRLISYASSATHAMVIFGVDIDPNGFPTKWLVENSWGDSAGVNGYLIMTTKWFKEYSFDIIVDREFISSEVIDSLSGHVNDLPMWHHLWKEPNE